jgi:hypothetical protein
MSCMYFYKFVENRADAAATVFRYSTLKIHIPQNPGENQLFKKLL